MGRHSGLGRAWERWQERVERGKGRRRVSAIRCSGDRSSSLPASDWKVELGERKQTVKVK